MVPRILTPSQSDLRRSFLNLRKAASPFGIHHRKGLRELANETKTPLTEKTDLRTQLSEVAERIRTMRDIMGISEEEMAQRTGVSVEDYKRYELGESDFSFTFIFKCAERFGIDPTDLIKGVSPTLSTYTVLRAECAFRWVPTWKSSKQATRSTITAVRRTA